MKRGQKWHSAGHGTGTAYNAGCRCGVCMKHHRSRMRALFARLKTVEPPVHGIYTTYCNYSCRCEPCSAAWAEKCKRDYRERLQRDKRGLPHGRLSTYTNYGCRCADCKAAASANYRAQVAAKKATDAAASDSAARSTAGSLAAPAVSDSRQGRGTGTARAAAYHAARAVPFNK